MEGLKENNRNLPSPFRPSVSDGVKKGIFSKVGEGLRPDRNDLVISSEVQDEKTYEIL